MNLIEDWGSYYNSCSTCGESYHEAEGKDCTCDEEEEEEVVVQIPKKIYKVTGLTKSGERFTIKTAVRFYALGINLWNGTVWEKEPFKENKWKMIKSVHN